MSAVAILLMGLGLKWLLEGRVLPRMLKRANALMLNEIVPPLESYFEDFQEWPTGPPEEIMWRLQGARGDRIPAVGAGGALQGTPSEAATVRTEQESPYVNYLRDARLRAAGTTLGDVWGRPLEFHFVPDGAATVTSLGPDGILGTADDMTVKANIVPRKTQPTRDLFLAEREFRRVQTLKEWERARRIEEKAK